MNKVRWAGVAVAFAAVATGCGTQKIRFYMTDAPLDGAKEVNVTLSGMKVFTSASCQDDDDETETDAGVGDDAVAKQDRVRARDGGEDCGGGPDTIVFDEARTYNLLTLRDGAQVLLGDVEVEGTVRHVMLKTDGIATIVYEDGSTRVARIPSGATSGLKAAPGTIRGDYSSSRQMNLVHASDGPDAAKREIDLYFKPDEILPYQPTLTGWLKADDES